MCLISDFDEGVDGWKSFICLVEADQLVVYSCKLGELFLGKATQVAIVTDVLSDGSHNCSSMLIVFYMGRLYSVLPELNTGVGTASADVEAGESLRFENEMNVVSGFKKDGSQTQD